MVLVEAYIFLSKAISPNSLLRSAVQCSTVAILIWPSGQSDNYYDDAALPTFIMGKTQEDISMWSRGVNTPRYMRYASRLVIFRRDHIV